jgi:bacterioferritin
MKGNPQLVKKLNDLLREELTGINQYMVHSEMCDNWGYERLHKAIEKRAIVEMKHAEKLIGRVLFLEGSPTVSEMDAIHIGPDVPKQVENDLELEMGAVRMYNEAIRLAAEVGDGATKEILDHILSDEDEHIDWLEEQLDQIAQMGLPMYLAMQTRA